MKKIQFLVLALLMYVSVSAQTVTLRFEGAGNSTNAAVRDYSVDLDGKKYYSANAENAGTAGARQLQISNLKTGTHKLAVYRIDNNSTVSSSDDAAVYSNTFQLRAGYDMVVAIRRNGQVAFTEKRNTATTVSGNTTAKVAMTDANFDKLLQSTKAKWSQTSRYTSIKTAITKKTNFFTTDQVGELLLLLTSEPRRLELAKLSYPKVTDPGNFADVGDLFSTQSNKDNIDKFILSKNPESSVGSSSDVSGSRPAISTQQFNQLLRTVRNQYQQSGKYAVLQDAFSINTNYFTTAQLRQLLPMITAESERLALAKQSYARVSDVANFPSLSNLFNLQASRDELNNYIRYGETAVSAGQYSNRIAMSEGEFSKLQLKARLHIRQSSTVEDVRVALADKNNYFSSEQIRSLLSLISTEPDRLALAKLAYHRATDPTTFTQLFDLFTTQASIDDLNNYIKANRS